MNLSVSEAVHTVRIVEREGALGRLRDAVLKVDRENPAPKDIANLQAVLRAEPSLARVLFDLSAVNTERVIAALAGDVLAREALSVTVESMRDALGYQEGSALERGLIERVVTCWLRVQQAEKGYTGLLNQTEVVIAHADWWERRMTGAHGRYLRAVEGLARVRRLTRPGAVQINRGDRQINVADVAMTEQQPSETQKIERTYDR